MEKSTETLFGESYDNGLNDAWNLAARINTDPMCGGLDIMDLKEIFQTADTSKIFIQNTYQEAAEKIKAWEDSKKIQTNDVVQDKDTGMFGLVFLIYYDNTCCVRWEDGSSAQKNMRDLAKTGHRIDVPALVRQKAYCTPDRKVDNE